MDKRQDVAKPRVAGAKANDLAQGEGHHPDSRVVKCPYSAVFLNGVSIILSRKHMRKSMSETWSGLLPIVWWMKSY